MTRPSFIQHYSEIQEPAQAYYAESDETFGQRASFGKHGGLQRIGVHHETLAPGHRTSFPHAEADEEEFIYVIEGTPDVWLDGTLHRLRAGDGVCFPNGTGIAHTFINNTATDVRLLVVGEKIKNCRVYYPENPERRERIGAAWWKP